MDQNTDNKVATTVSAYFTDRPGVAAVYLFGSQVAGPRTPESDVDIGILYEPGAEPELFTQMEDQIELSRQLGRDVDLVNLGDASPILRMQVLRKGILVLNRHPRLVIEFFVNTHNEYFDLKQSRKPIEESLYNHRIYD